MARVNPTDPLESIDIRQRTLDRLKIGKVRQTVFNIGEDYEDPKVQFKYYRIMAARYGDGFVISRRQSGNLWSWGCSASDGQLGLGDTSPTATPTLIDTGELDFSRVFATGRAHTIALDVSGAPYTWGNNQYGQIGIPLYYYGGIVLGVGDSMSAAIDSNGTLWTWGINIYGELGDGTWNTIRSTPTVVVDAGPWARLTNYPDFAEDICRDIPGICKGTGDIGDGIWAIKEDGTLWRSGRCNYGQLGIGLYNTSRSSPVSVLDSAIRNFWQCSGGQTTMGCIDQLGDVWTWGRGSDGKLGTWGPTTGSPLSINSPVNVNSTMNSNPISIHTGFQTATIKNLSVGANHCTAIDITGQAWGWGNNLNGQIGNNENPNAQGYPVSTSHTIVFKQTAAGNSNSMWLDVDGNVWMSGYNDFGRFGMQGINQQTSTPTIVIGSPHQAIKIASSNGGDSFGFLRDDGTLWLWGENDYAQAGIGYPCPNPASPPCDSGGTNKVTSPASVIGSGQSYKFIDFWLGGDHTIALDDEGNLWAWGKNPECGVGISGGYNQTPISVTFSSGLFSYGVDVNSPTRLLTPNDFGIFGRAAAAGWGHTLMVDQNDSIAWAWGFNNYGQLGVGDTTNRISPALITLGSGRRFRKIDAGDEHSISLDQGGRLWAWGANAYGQLGNGRGEDSYQPAVVMETTAPILSFDFRDSLVSNNNDWVGHQTGFTVHPYRYGSGAYSAGWYSGFFEYEEGITPTSWTEPVVLSVEYKYFTISSGDHHETSFLTKGQNIDYCVPFLAGILQNSTSNLNRAFCRVALEGTNVVRCSTGPADSGTVNVGTYIVEFNPQRVKVQRGQFDIGGQTFTVTLDEPVNMKKAFIHIQWRSEGTNDNWRDAMVRARITDPETIVIDRYDGSGDMDVRWWVVESLDDAFDVETVEWQHLSAGHGDHYGSLYQSPVVGNNTNFNRAMTLVTCKNNQSGNTVDKQPVAFFDDSSGTFYSKANNNPSIPGRVVDYVGQVITFNDASKNMNADANGFLRSIDFGEFPRNVTKANLLTQNDNMYFPGRYSGSENMYLNPDYGMVYCSNPQGMNAAIGYSSETHYLSSNQFLFTYTDGTLTMTRGAAGGGTAWWDVFEFDNFSETSENSGRVAKSKTRTFGALDGSSAMDGSYVPFPDLSTTLNVGVAVEGVSTPITGSNPFTIKTVIKTPAVGSGYQQYQLIFAFAGSYDIYGTPAYGTCCRFFYADNRAGSQKGRLSVDLGSGMTSPVLDNFFEPETWYTLHFTYDGGTTTKLFVDNELVLTTTLAGTLNISGGLLNFFTTGYTSNRIFTGMIDSYAMYDRDLSEDEISGEGTEQKFIEVAAGSQSSYGIDVNGMLYAWGDNTYGQLGDGTTTDKSAPVSVAGRHSFIQVTGGGRISEGHACGLKADGTVWCWGRNNHGQLGLCDYTDRSSPESVVGRHSFIDVWAAKDGYNTIAIKLDGSVWVWGMAPFCEGIDQCSPVSIPDFNLITLNILGRGYLEDHSLYLEY